MTDYELSALLERNDPAAVERARALGEAAADMLAPALAAPDPERRLLVIQALQAAGGRRAGELLVDALADGNRQVRAFVVQALLDAPPQRALEARLLLAWDRSPCPTVRRGVPMVLGRMGGGAAIAALQGRLAEHEAARDGLLAGLARLGDPAARARWARILEGARGPRTKALSALLPYVGEPWQLPHLAPWLERTEVVDVLASHLRDLRRRACDLAMDEVVRQLGPELELTREELYGPEAIARARAHLATLERVPLEDAPPE